MRFGEADEVSGGGVRIEGEWVEADAVVVSSLPYRGPPAPYGVAMELAAYCRREGRDARVVLTTPEEVPLASIGGGVPEFLRSSCAAVGVLAKRRDRVWLPVLGISFVLANGLMISIAAITG